MRKYTILIIILATLVFSQSTMNTTRKLSLRMSSGIIHYPLTEWYDFFSYFESYEQDKINHHLPHNLYNQLVDLLPSPLCCP